LFGDDLFGLNFTAAQPEFKIPDQNPSQGNGGEMKQPIITNRVDDLKTIFAD
jgi:hypothetical protein